MTEIDPAELRAASKSLQTISPDITTSIAGVGIDAGANLIVSAWNLFNDKGWCPAITKTRERTGQGAALLDAVASALEAIEGEQ